MRLNIATRHSHAEVDEPWLDLLHPSVSRADYLNLLVRMYGFVGPFEGACKYTPDLDRIPLIHHTRAGLIAQDLLALGLTPGQIANLPQCHSITTYRGVGEALGWLYVVERTTLLHDGVHRHLQLHLPEVGEAFSYLSAYDGRVGEHWTTFGRLLDRIATKPEDANEIVHAAQAAFETLKDWFHTMRSHAKSAG
jgi:heme oxygenase